MTGTTEPLRSLDDLTSGQLKLRDLVSRDVATELIQSFHDLFKLPVRLLDAQGLQLAAAWEQPALYAHLDGTRAGSERLAQTAQEVLDLAPMPDATAQARCVTGAVYVAAAVAFDQRVIGKLVLGPVLPPGVTEPSAELTALVPETDPKRLADLLGRMPRGREETLQQVLRFLGKSLDLVLFSGHRTLLTSNLHLATVQESFRELTAKNTRLQEAVDRLKELDRLKSNFLATVSHELKTPLTSIIGYSEMLAEGIAGDLTAEQRDFVQTIREKGDQLLELIKSLLDLSKMESGTLTLRKADTAVGPLVDDVVATLTPAARKKDVTLSARIEGALPTIWADAERIRQVLVNLTENAVKFTPPGGRVEVSAVAGMASSGRPDDDDDSGLVLFSGGRPAVIVRVADTGIGIPVDERSRVFDAFYQVDSSSTREAGGTGLGLSIVKRLVDAHDGNVHIEGNKPTGTVMVVTLPCRRSSHG